MAATVLTKLNASKPQDDDQWVEMLAGKRWHLYLDRGVKGHLELIRYGIGDVVCGEAQKRVTWVVVSVDSTGAKWAQSYPSLSQFLAAYLAD